MRLAIYLQPHLTAAPAIVEHITFKRLTFISESSSFIRSGSLETITLCIGYVFQCTLMSQANEGTKKKHNKNVEKESKKWFKYRNRMSRMDINNPHTRTHTHIHPSGLLNLLFSCMITAIYGQLQLCFQSLNSNTFNHNYFDFCRMIKNYYAAHSTRQSS